MMGGYMGRILRVDLSSGKIVDVETSKDLISKYIGGLGFVVRILWDEIDERTDPLGPENRLVIATGPLTGTMFPAAGRYQMGAKSPLTGVWGQSNSGGFFGPELKFSGYDAIIIQGRSERPVYLCIYDGKPEIKRADHLWGKNTYETADMIREELDDREVKIAAIGQAGENLVRYAAVINDHGRAAARSGMGAVMGSKKLKAIAVRGFGSVKVADMDGFMKLYDELHERMLSHPYTPDRVKYGTTSLVELMNAIGRLPTYNMQQGVFEYYEEISGERLRELYFVKPHADMACLQRCGRIVRTGGRYEMFGKGPEYEALDSFGARCGVRNLEAVIYANHLANLYGMDAISAGASISWAMECYEKGIITKEDAGVDLSWGNYEAVIQLIHDIAFRRGFGNILAEGSYRASRIIGRGSEKYAMHVKGLEISAQDGRAQQSSGLTHATAARGADHLTSLSCLEERGYANVAAERYGEDKVKDLVDPLSTKYKGMLVKDLEDLYALGNSLIICWYEVGWPPVFYFDEMAEALHVVTGVDLFSSVSYVREAAERIVILRRMFNIREGLRRKDDTLPERFLREPMPSGPAKGHVCRLDEMLDEYYEHRGIDKTTGIPKDETLIRLGLGDLAGRYR
ncbi:MAG: aldehyde:ferredoxin oxidoreductase [Thermoproteota archaeon]|nr:MAG: aldehyde:ferredoxin oxidoreductase [Candidatus Korarchaeota archaeon]